MCHARGQEKPSPAPSGRLPPGIPSTSGDGLDEQANRSPRLALAGRRTLAGCRRTVGCVIRSRLPFAALCRTRVLPRPRPELPDLQRAVAIPDQPVDIPRTGLGKPELHGFAVQGASRLREDPAPLPSYIANESSATEAAVIYAPGSSVSQPAYDFPETPLLYFFEGGAYGEIAFETVPGDQFIGGSPPATPSQPSTTAVRRRESAPRMPTTLSLAGPALWRLQYRPG